jgi:hypothetical protein
MAQRVPIMATKAMAARGPPMAPRLSMARFEAVGASVGLGGDDVGEQGVAGGDPEAERHFGLKLAFQNCHRVAAFRLDATTTGDYQAFVSPRAQLLNQSPALRDC